MPTTEDIAEFRAQRARFLNTVWDAASRGQRHPAVQSILHEAARDLDPRQASHLILTLIDDGLLVGGEMSIADLHPQHVWLTPQGRDEVERWVTTDQPTEHLPLTHSQVYNNNFYGAVQGSPIVIGADNTTINQTNQFANQLMSIVDKTRQLLDEQRVEGEGREDIEADLSTLTDQAATSSQDTGRIRSALRRLNKWTSGLIATGVSAALITEITELTNQALIQIGR